MNNLVHSYDIELYNRNFLNCAQRHSIVMLKEAGLPVDWLFYNAQVSTDCILEQCIKNRIPKYDFSYNGLTDTDFACIGVTRKSHLVDSFSEAKPHLLNSITRDGFVLLAGDVFYFPHCPEYRNKHLFHLVILTGYDSQTNVWNIIDDNPASVLCHYSWNEELVAAFYENNIVREYRSYAHFQRPTVDIAAEIRQLFIASQSTYFDSLELLTQIESLLNTQWFSPKSLYHALSESFSLLSGSRQCFAQYLRLANYDLNIVDLASLISDKAIKLRNAFTKGKITGQIDFVKVVNYANDIATLEEKLRTEVCSKH